MRLGASGFGMLASIVLSFGMVLSVGACAGGDKEEPAEEVAPAPDGDAAAGDDAGTTAPAPEEKKDGKKAHKKGDKKGHKKGDKKAKKKK